MPSVAALKAFTQVCGDGIARVTSSIFDDGRRATDPKWAWGAGWNRSTATYIYNHIVSAKVSKIAEADFPTRWGQFRIHGFEGQFPPAEAGGERRKESVVALVMGNISTGAPLVRIHSQCLTGDVFGSLRCDCRQQLELALQMISDEGRGILIYEQQEGRGIGLMAKLQAYALQDDGLDTIEANEKLGFAPDCREYNLPVEVLKALGLKQIKLLSNNPDKVAAVENAGIKVVERVSAEVVPSEHATRYVETKRDKMGHYIGTK
jgi:GTP cyclohydrolase II